MGSATRKSSEPSGLSGVLMEEEMADSAGAAAASAESLAGANDPVRNRWELAGRAVVFTLLDNIEGHNEEINSN